MRVIKLTTSDNRTRSVKGERKPGCSPGRRRCFFRQWNRPWPLLRLSRLYLGAADERHQSAALTGLDNTPMFSTSTSTMSPGDSGPMPAGVPVIMTSPGSSVIMLAV